MRASAVRTVDRDEVGADRGAESLACGPARSVVTVCIGRASAHRIKAVSVGPP
jgi:hypothetical protein